MFIVLFEGKVGFFLGKSHTDMREVTFSPIL